MAYIRLDQKLKRVELSSFEIENDITFNYFDKLPADQRDEQLLRAIYIGVLALMEDRLAAFLSRTSNELGTELEHLKIIFDMKQELFFKSAIKGALAEEDIARFLTEYFSTLGLADTVRLTGAETGSMPRNKTGDIVCEVDGIPEYRIVIECKFDKSISLGDIGDKDIFTKKSDTIWSQLIEAQANRDGKVSIIVLDYSLVDSSVLKVIRDVRYIPQIGFISIIDSQKGDYSHLSIAYALARDIAVNAKEIEFDKDLLSIILNRIIKDIGEVHKIKNLVNGNIESNKKILLQLDKSTLLMRFNQKFLTSFLKTGSLTREDLLDFYSAEEVKDEFRLIEREIKEL